MRCCNTIKKVRSYRDLAENSSTSVTLRMYPYTVSEYLYGGEKYGGLATVLFEYRMTTGTQSAQRVYVHSDFSLKQVPWYNLPVLDACTYGQSI